MAGEDGKRLIYIYLLRWAAILSVILLHSISPYFTDAGMFGTKTWWFINVINGCTRFGVPVFFMISGYLLLSDSRELSIGDFLKKRLGRVLLPFFLWNIIYYIYYCPSWNEELSPARFLYSFVTMGISYHFWFVYTLLLLYLVVPVFKKFIAGANGREMLYLFLVIIFPTTIGTVINKTTGLWLFRFEPVIAGYFGYMVLGFYLGTHELSQKARVILYASAAASIVISIFRTYHYSSAAVIDDFFNSGYQFNSYVIAAAVFVLGKGLCRRFKNRRLISIIKAHGSLSFGVYLVHVIVLTVLQRAVVFDKLYKVILFDFIASAAISFFVVYILSKIKGLRRILL